MSEGEYRVVQGDVLPICEHEGCNEVGNEYVIFGYVRAPHFTFCDQHAADFGFCVYCGNFIGGTEDVFITGQSGMCFDCYIQLEQELAENEDEYEDEWDSEL